MGICDSSAEIVNPTSQKFFSDLSHTQTINSNNNSLSEKVKLKVLISQINTKSKYDIKLYNRIGNKNYSLNEISECSISGNKKEAKLESPILIQYFFEKEQPLLIEIIKTSNGKIKKYEINTTLGCIMGSRHNTFEKNISPSTNEIIIIKVEKLRPNEDVIDIKFGINENQYLYFKEEKDKIYYEIYSGILLYRSECINVLGRFNPVKIPLNLFKNNKIKILFIRNTKKTIKEFKMNIDDFLRKKKIDVKIDNTTFQIKSRSKLTKNYTFVDYLIAGIQIGLTVAIDFTESNGNPNYPNSLHFIGGNIPNQYERAITACGNIVGYYDYDQLFPCFGFGGIINNVPMQLFSLNFQQDPNIKYIEGIIEAYHNAINYVQLSSPTLFAPIIREVNRIIKEQANKITYHILMILTNGVIDDLEQTVDELVEGSFYPLSVIIIGIGNGDFSNMVYLDADENPLVNSRGVSAVRDLVQFVPFLKYESNPENLAIEVLEEIPRQIIDYYDQNDIEPINFYA